MKNASVLVVEDDPNMQTLLEHVLLWAGFNVTIADNGLVAKEKLSSDHYDLICSDVMMSGIDGIQLCIWVKSQESLRHIPFILLSARAQNGEKEVGLQAGADAYMTKPFDILELEQTLKKILSRTE
jgi:two-component system, OmpR family, response regulator